MKIVSVEDLGKLITSVCELRNTSPWAVGQYCQVSSGLFLRIVRAPEKDTTTFVMFEFADATDCVCELRLKPGTEVKGISVAPIQVTASTLNIAIRMLAEYRGLNFQDMKRDIRVFPSAFERGNITYRLAKVLFPALEYFGIELHISPLSKKAIRGKLQVSGGGVY